MYWDFFIAILTFVLGLILVVLFGVFAVGGVFKGSGLFGVLAAVFGYLTFILLAGAVVTALISAPILGHYVNTLRVENAEPLEQIRQRTGYHIADADGFVDALDIGGAF